MSGLPNGNPKLWRSLTGNQRAPGPQGLPGEPGSPGAAGLSGPIGPSGSDGGDGEAGPPGAQGATGPAGAAGSAGPAGPPGFDGAAGEDGAQGPPGSAGPTGATGATGPTGPVGPQGPIGFGMDGETGEDSYIAGPAGSPGQSGAMVLLGTSSPSGVASVTFSGIVGTYADLMVVIRGSGSASAGNVTANLTLNNDTAAHYQHDFLQGTSTATPSNTATVGASNIPIAVIPAATASNAGGYAKYIIYSYAGTTFNKTVEVQSGLSISALVTGLFTRQGVGFWLSTAAVTRVDITLSSGNFSAGSLVSLYGITG